MKTNVGFALAGLCSVIASGIAAPAASAAAPTLPASGPQTSASAAESAPPITLTEALQRVATATRYVAHPPEKEPGDLPVDTRMMSPDFVMPAPPPAPRAESKPLSPAAGNVWVPGHYMPVKGEWRWVTGEWAVPATPSSVWIAARYDPNSHRWSPGYWQPDRPPQPQPESAATKKDGKAATSATPAPY